jgi:Predicted integral membrane protein (DUF2189)
MTARSRHHDGSIRRSSRQRPDRKRNRVRIEDVGQERTPPTTPARLSPLPDQQSWSVQCPAQRSFLKSLRNARPTRAWRMIGTPRQEAEAARAESSPCKRTLVRQVFTTPSGWFLLVAGNGVGFVFAVVVLTISVISFPLLLDRDIGAGAGHSHVSASGSRQPNRDGNVGARRRRQPDDRLGAMFRRPRRRDASTRTFDLASVSQGYRA